MTKLAQENSHAQLVGIERSKAVVLSKVPQLKGLSKCSERKYNYNQRGEVSKRSRSHAVLVHQNSEEYTPSL